MANGKVGRPKKLDKYGGQITEAEDRIAGKLPDLVDKLFELSEGVEVERHAKDGFKVYSEPPNFKAIEYLLNRIMGRPTERVEHSGEDGGPIETRRITIVEINPIVRDDGQSP